MTTEYVPSVPSPTGESSGSRAHAEGRGSALIGDPEPLTECHVVLSLDFGGLERIVLDLVRQGRRRGHAVSVVCLERPGNLAPQVKALGAEVFCVGKPPGRRPEIIGPIRGLLRQIRPDVVHSHQIGALLYTGPAARREAVPLVVHTEHTNHTLIRTTAGDRLRIRLLWAVASHFAARFFCVSDDIADAVTAYYTVPRRKVFVVDNGIDTDAFRPDVPAAEVRRSLAIPPEVPVIGTLGRLNEVKRQDLLLHAFASVKRQHHDTRLVLIGDGPKMNELRALADALHIADCVHFLGYQANPQHFLQAIDVFALSSRLEGMPLAVLEAWSMGLPVVATRVGGLSRLIEHGKNGLLVDPGDPAALATALSGLVADRDRARKMGREGQDLVRSRFDVRVMAASYERHYREALVGKRVQA